MTPKAQPSEWVMLSIMVAVLICALVVVVAGGMLQVNPLPPP